MNKNKVTGLTRRLYPLGRLCIPIELRRQFKINSGDPVLMTSTPNGILVNKEIPSCAFCDVSTDLRSFRKGFICPQCLQLLSSELNSMD